jgi:hypothetical protein
MDMKILKVRSVRQIFALLLALLFVSLAVGCAKEDEKSGGEKVLAYENVDISKAVSLGEYKGLSVTLLDSETKAQAIWRVILDSSEVLEYPAEQVDYYLSQSKARCEYYASIHNVSYEEALAALGYSEESMLGEAKELVASDMIGIAIRESAGITLTDDEKDRLFDKYAEKYAQDWGYNLAYVKDSLAEEVYGLMLYDKTTEYLIINNTFVTAE